MHFLRWLKSLFSKNKPVTDTVTTQGVAVQEEDSLKTDKDRFEKAMKFVRVVEGGKFFHPNDPGGFTNMGLTQRDYPKLDLKNLTRARADNIFYRDYWKKSSASKLPDPVFIIYFDTVVNAGVSRANKILQRALNVVPDGKIGPITLEALKNSNYLNLALNMIDEREKFYENLTKQNSKFKSFIKGWIRRNKAIEEYIRTGSFSW